MPSVLVCFHTSWVHDAPEGERSVDNKPLIALNSDFRTNSKDTTSFSFLADGYYNAVTAAGAIPVVLPPLANRQDLGRLLDLVEGVVMVGGADLNPNNDGFMKHPSIRLLNEQREDFDRLLIRMISERRMPVMGVGVGMQLLNVQQGGNLYFHIPEDLPNAMPHSDRSDITHRHGLDVVEDSLMGRIYGDGEVRVNSMHHMAIDEVAVGFRVTARAPDGVIEAIESSRDDWFAFGTQFHPESHSASALDQRIFEEFVDGVPAGGSVRLVA